MDIENYLSQGYFDENNQPRKELYLDWSRSIAENLSRQGMTKGALRRFYAQVKGLQPLMEKNFEANKYRLYAIVPLVNYGVNKEDSPLPKEFKSFIEQNVKQAEKDLRHYQFFVDHFQCVVAYFKESTRGNSR